MILERQKRGYVPEGERAARFQSGGRGTYIGDMGDNDVTVDPPPGRSSATNNLAQNISRTLHKQIINATTSDPMATTADILELYGTGSPQWDCEVNDTMCFFNMSSFEFDNETSIEEPMEYRYWAILLIIIPILTVFGNILVVMSVYRERSLRTVTNYFICSLAVADIFVAVLVMPFAVYMEVTTAWLLSDPLCDAWVASDVMACTSSILNLTAISVDRFIAVTQPIKYSKHKNSKRVFVMLALTWVISVAIAAPIALGVNYSDKRTPGACNFFNADFLIYSSMGSFYIPSLIMIYLYYRIWRVLHARSQRLLAQKKKLKTDQKAIKSVIENTAATAAPPTEPTVTTGLARIDNGKPASYNTNTAHKLAAPVADDTSVTNAGTGSDSQGENDSNGNDGSDSKTPEDNGTHIHGVGELIANPVAEALDKQETAGNNSGGTTSGDTPSAEAETKFNSPNAPRCAQLSPLHTKGSVKKDENRNKETHKKGVTKFNFHMRTSRKRKERSSSKRERKATKTLAIVLGVFLLCWWPFFTINIINAICIRYDLFEYAACNSPVVLIGILVWLGYINSFLNPVIYTIFNPEFRKAFKKILTERCK